MHRSSRHTCHPPHLEMHPQTLIHMPAPHAPSPRPHHPPHQWIQPPSQACKQQHRSVPQHHPESSKPVILETPSTASRPAARGTAYKDPLNGASDALMPRTQNHQHWSATPETSNSASQADASMIHTPCHETPPSTPVHTSCLPS